MIAIENTRYSQLKNKPVFDTEGVKLGRVIDLVFSIEDSTISVSSFILGDSPFEEFLEKIGAKPEDDLVICKTQIEAIGESIELVDKKEQVAKHLEECQFQDRSWTFTNLSKVPILDSDGNNIGNIIDVWFDLSGAIWFVVGGGIIEETLERAGIIPDVDFLVSPRTIKEFNQDAIKITWSMDDIEAAYENNTDPSDIMIRS